jgi:hypothetical protein
MLSGAPTRDHTGTIELRETDTGTEVSWHLQATLKLPAIDRLALPVGKKFIDQLLEAAITAAERPATREPIAALRLVDDADRDVPTPPLRVNGDKH